MQPLVKRAWAKRGQTPIQKRKAGHHRKITAIGAICTKAGGRRPRLRFRLHPQGNANAAVCVAFLEQLLLTERGPITLIWDNLPAHRSRKVKSWIKRHPRIQIEYLPPYAPELNPIEYAWSYLKYHRLANFAPREEAELHARAKREICRLRCEPELVHSFIRHCPLRFG